MAIKEILEDLAHGESEHRKQMAEAEKLTRITFSARYPKRLPPGVEKEDSPYTLDALEKATVDRFLEKFILGAIDVYRSDRSLR